MLSTSILQRLGHRRTTRMLAPVAIIVLAWLLFFWRILTPVQADRLTFQQGDFTLQFLAYRQMAYRQLAAGRFPFFEECLYGGYPFQADPQSQVLYPPVIGAMLLGRLLGWVTYPLRALEWEVMLHVLGAALAMYAFLRSMRLRRLACEAGALAYAFGGFITGYAMLQTAILETAAWLPLVLLALRGLAQRPPGASSAWLRDAALLAISVALAFTAGHPQTLLFTVYTGAAAFTFWAWKARLPGRQALLRAALAACLAMGLAAVQLIPSLSFMLGSTRSALPFDDAGTGFVLHDIALFVLTGVINVWQPLYVGIISLLLCGIALTARRSEALLWIGIAAGALILSFGANALGFDLAYIAAPGYKQFHSQERHALIVVFALCVLCAIGMNVLLSPLRRRARLRLWKASGTIGLGALFAFTALIAVLVYVNVVDPKRPEIGIVSDRIALIALALLSSAALIAWRARLGQAPRWLWGTLLLGLLIFDLFTVNRYTATQTPAEPFPPLVLAEPAKTASELPDTLRATGAYRIYNHYGLPLNGACVNGLKEIGGGSPIVLRDYQTFLARTPEDVYSQLLNVRYTVTWRGGMGTDNGTRIPDRKLATDKYQDIVANTFLLDWPAPGPQPAWIVSAVIPVNSEAELYKRLNADDFHPGGQALIYTRDVSQVPASAPGASGAPGTAGLEGKATGYMKIAASASGPALLVVSEAYHWNWVALVNGVQAATVETDGALLGVPLPKGNSSIELSYRPIDFYAGAVITVASFLTLIALLALSRVRREPNQGTIATSLKGPANSEIQ